MLKKGTPGKGGGARTDSFSYTPVQSGLKNGFHGWIAGETYWCQAHEHSKATPGTKPCLEWMTEGAVRCPRCRPQVVTTWVGYVPLYREADHKPIIIILHEGAMDLLAGLAYPDYVLVGRVDMTSSVFVRKSDNALSFRTDNEQRKAPRDITPDLLTMWQMPALEEWIMAQRRKQPKPTVTAPRIRGDGKPFSPFMQGAAAKHGLPEGVREPASDVGDALSRVARRAAAAGPSTNGHHEGES